MENSWKAKCVDEMSSNWKRGGFISVVDRVIVDCSEKECIGLSFKSLKTFKSWNKSSMAKWELITDEPTADNINPSHYKSQCSLECIEAMQMAFGKEMVYDFCICNAWKYMWRYENKNGVEDIGKARWYIEKAKELGFDLPEVYNLEYVLEKIEKEIG